MTDPSTGAALPAPDSPAPAPKPARSRWNGLLLLLALAAAAAAGWSYWQLRLERGRGERERAEWQGVSQALEARVAALDRALEATRERQRSIDTRINENAASSRVLREEVLGIGERAGLLEDAVARIAESRERGDVALRLDEIEFLLQLGEERLRLFADAHPARTAFGLAADALAAVDDPALAGLRQTLAQERANLEAAADPRPSLRRQLAELRVRLPGLPARDAVPEAAPAGASRLWQLLGKLVTVRRIDDSQAALSPVERASRQAHLQLQLGLAEAALERADRAAWQAALEHVLAAFDGLYDPAAGAVVDIRARIEAARSTDPQPAMVEVGATLREIRALRATRRTPSPAPAAATPADNPAVEAGSP